MGKLILILGGVRSGKSKLAEQMATQLGGDRVLYVATAEPGDDEMKERITAHQQHRPAQWPTLEAPIHVADHLITRDLPDVILLDCVTFLASNVLLTLPDDCTSDHANTAVLSEIEALLGVYQQRSFTWIVVSNEVGMGIVPPYRLGRLYRDALGAANQRLAETANEVILMVAGLPWYLKGR